MPRFYDAFNVEADLKAGALPAHDLGRSSLQTVQDMERRAVLGAAAITTCSAEDAAILAHTHARSLTDFTVVPNGTDCGTRCRRPEARRRPPRPLAPAVGGDASRAPPGRPSTSPCSSAAGTRPTSTRPRSCSGWPRNCPTCSSCSGGSHGDAFADRRLPANLVFTGVIDAAPNERCSPPPTSPSTRCCSARARTSRSSSTWPPGSRWSRPASASAGSTRSTASTCCVAEPHEMVDAVRRRARRSRRCRPPGRAGRALAVEHYDWTTLGDRLADVRRSRAAAAPTKAGR